jgi:hypothetical protein
LAVGGVDDDGDTLGIADVEILNGFGARMGGVLYAVMNVEGKMLADIVLMGEFMIGSELNIGVVVWLTGSAGDGLPLDNEVVLEAVLMG